MTNPSKQETVWAPKCPKCPEVAFIIGEIREPRVAGVWVRLVLTCQNGHSWAAEYLVVDPING
jgi:hypothetical protein